MRRWRSCVRPAPPVDTPPPARRAPPALDETVHRIHAVIASEAKQSRAVEAPPIEIASSPAAPRNDTFCLGHFLVSEAKQSRLMHYPQVGVIGGNERIMPEKTIL